MPIFLAPTRRFFCLLLTALLCGSGLTAGADDARTVICIDPGHSKATVGTHGKKLIEYQICWQMAVKLKAELEQRGFQVILTKPTMDANVSNEDRARTANKAHAALLLRLHCDAGTEAGIATFFPDKPGMKDGVRGPSPAVIAASRAAAHTFHAALLKTLAGALHDRKVRPDTQTAIGGKQGALTGSIFSQVPVLLVEMCVLSQPKDEAFLASAKGQGLLARAMADGAAAATHH